MEKLIERTLFAGRWLMAPFYLGLMITLVILLYSFMEELIHILLNIQNITQNDAVLAALSLIDLSLAGNLLLIVVFSGYENFVSKMHVDNHEDKPDWMGTVDFSTLKLKLIASIVAISGIHLLKIFMDVAKYSDEQIRWMIIIHLVFVISGVFLALMDLIASKAKQAKKSK